jgi:flagellar biosynthesis repressor protein FlbT
MPLRIQLKPYEKFILNGVVLQNEHRASTLIVHSEAAFLREKDILAEEMATTPARRIYFALQCLFLFPAKHEVYLPMLGGLLAEFAAAAPSTLPILQKIEQEIAAERLYHALKAAKQLIANEEETLNSACVAGMHGGAVADPRNETA